MSNIKVKIGKIVVSLAYSLFLRLSVDIDVSCAMK